MTSEARAAVRYRAFISYSHRDARCARWLHRALETYRTPRALVGSAGRLGPVPAAISPVFRDEDELAGAPELSSEIEAALRASAALVVVCSPAAAASPWVDREIRRFRSLAPGRPVLAVITSGEPDGEPSCFPLALRYGVDPAGELDRSLVHEPLAPDLQKQDRHAVKLKLVAGLLGVSYSDLVRRDLVRTRRRAAAAGSAGVVVIALLAVLAVTALSYARMAVHQRDLARRAEAAAQRNAEEADRRAWLAQAAAGEVRRQADLLKALRPQKATPPRP